MQDTRWLRAALLMRHKTQARVCKALKQIPLEQENLLGAVRRAKGELKSRGLRAWIPHRAPHMPILIVQGRTPSRLGVAVVGSRASDGYGLACARRVAQDVVRLGLPVISGGAEGCDASAHQAALDAGGETVVVLGSGHDHLYPRCHRDLFDRVIANGGGIISPYWPDTRPNAFRFVARNRVIADLSEVTVVVRARRRSGALSTAGYARKRGRRVLAVPSDVGEALGQGCNELLAQGAEVVCGLGDLARALELPGTGTWAVGHRGRPAPWPELDANISPPAQQNPSNPTQKRVLEALQAQPDMDLDSLVETTGLPVEMVSTLVLELEISGRVRRIGSHRFESLKKC